jgi:hypothetical protein
VELKIEVVQGVRGAQESPRMVWDVKLCTYHAEDLKGWSILKSFRWSDARANYQAFMLAVSFATFFQCKLDFEDMNLKDYDPYLSLPEGLEPPDMEITGWRVKVTNSLERKTPMGSSVGKPDENGNLQPAWYTVYLIKETNLGDQSIEWDINYDEGKGHNWLLSRTRSDAEMLAMKFGCELHFLDEEPHDVSTKWRERMESIKKDIDNGTNQ